MGEYLLKIWPGIFPAFFIDRVYIFFRFDYNRPWIGGTGNRPVPGIRIIMITPEEFP